MGNKLLCTWKFIFLKCIYILLLLQKKFNDGNNNCSEIAKVLKEITVFLSASSGAFNGYNLNRLAFIMQNKSQEPLKGKIG